MRSSDCRSDRVRPGGKSSLSFLLLIPEWIGPSAVQAVTGNPAQNEFQRVVATLRNGFLTTSVPAEMLSYNCVICGKGLTDPASMARWIGPECAGTSTLRVPFIITANQTTTPELKQETHKER